MIEITFWLLVGHALADYPLQGDFLAKHKDPAVGRNGLWLHALTAHAMIHAGAVALVTGSVYIGLGEFFLHWLIDLGKCSKFFGFHTDQFLHIGCKVAWAALVAWGAA